MTSHLFASLILVVLAGLMFYYDYQALFGVWVVDRTAAERQLDQAEYWLRSPLAPALKWLTLGYINPHRTVHDEVRKALTSASISMTSMMWRWSLQTAVRLGFGSVLWLTFAISG
jgi:hypothetical protein